MFRVSPRGVTRRKNTPMSKNLATTFALTAAALFLGGCGKDAPPTQNPGADAAPAADGAATDVAAASDDAGEVKCFGVNTCAGESACDVAGAHDCGGQNECKGKGWILIPKSDCDSQGGTIL